MTPLVGDKDVWWPRIDDGASETGRDGLLAHHAEVVVLVAHLARAGRAEDAARVVIGALEQADGVGRHAPLPIAVKAAWPSFLGRGDCDAGRLEQMSPGYLVPVVLNGDIG